MSDSILFPFWDKATKTSDIAVYLLDSRMPIDRVSLDDILLASNGRLLGNWEGGRARAAREHVKQYDFRSLILIYTISIIRINF
jgi:hypothetical protein